MRITTCLLLLCLLASACRAESVTRVRVAADGGITLVSEFAFDDEALELIGEEGDTPEEVLESLAEVIDPGALPVARPGVLPVQFERGELKGLRVTFADMSPDDIERQVTSGSSLIRNLKLSVDGEQLLVAGSTRIATPSELGRLREAAPGDISEVLGITLAIEVAGEVTSHNASRVDGNVYEWDLLPAVTELQQVPVQLAADVGAGFELADEADTVADAGQPGSEEGAGTSLIAMLLGFLVVGAIGLVVLRRVLRR